MDVYNERAFEDWVAINLTSARSDSPTLKKFKECWNASKQLNQKGEEALSEQVTMKAMIDLILDHAAAVRVNGQGEEVVEAFKQIKRALKTFIKE